MYVKPKENEVTVVLTKLNQTEVKFQQEKIDRLEKEINRIFPVDAEELRRDSSGNAVEELPSDNPHLYELFTPGKDNFCFIAHKSFS